MRAGVIKGPVEPTSENFEWNAGSAVFIQAGDLINKGDDSIESLEFAMNLETKAAKAGGKAIFVAGNHEVGFIAAPFDPKYDALRKEVEYKGLNLCPEVYSPLSVRGAWIRDRPAAAVVNGIYFSHSGYSQQKNLTEIGNLYRQFVDKNDWDSGFMCGSRDYAKTELGFFNANEWWGNKGEVLDAGLKALNAKQILFGHDPNVFKSRGAILSYFNNSSGRALTKLDVGMWQGDSRGAIFRCRKFYGDGGCAQPERLSNPPYSSRFVLPPEQAPQFEPVPSLPGPPPVQTYNPPKGRC